MTEKFGRERKILRTDRINKVLDEAAKIKLPDNNFVFQHIKNGRVGHYTKDRIQYLIKRYWHPLHRPKERKRLGVHRIRHCMTVAARQEGASQIQISKMLGHTNPTSVLAYLDNNDHVAAAKTIDNVLDTLGL